MTASIPEPLRERFASGLATEQERQDYLARVKALNRDAYIKFRSTMTTAEYQQIKLRLAEHAFDDEFDFALAELMDQPFIPRTTRGLAPCKCGYRGSIIRPEEDFVICPNCGRTRHRFSRRKRFVRRVRRRFGRT